MLTVSFGMWERQNVKKAGSLELVYTNAIFSVSKTVNTRYTEVLRLYSYSAIYSWPLCTWTILTNNQKIDFYLFIRY